MPGDKPSSSEYAEARRLKKPSMVRISNRSKRCTSTSSNSSHFTSTARALLPKIDSASSSRPFGLMTASATRSRTLFRMSRAEARVNVVARMDSTRAGSPSTNPLCATRRKSAESLCVLPLPAFASTRVICNDCKGLMWGLVLGLMWGLMIQLHLQAFLLYRLLE